MTMLYKAVGGVVQQTHYGLALAGVVPFPPPVLADATHFAHTLERRLAQKKKLSPNILRERRRNLILDLKEHLLQAYNGSLEGELLASWLKELQKEFINRMTAINESMLEVAEEDEYEEDAEDDNDGNEEDVEMVDRGSLGHEDHEEHELRSLSAISVSSGTLALESLPSSQAI